MNRIGIIGGGASGIVAAIAAARSGGDAQVFILEQKENIGKKILATGNGRCNLTNEAMDASCYHGEAETNSVKLVSGCKSTLNSVFLYSDTVFFNYVFYFSL